MNLTKTLGIIGGMGPFASVKLYELITSFTPAQGDKDHLNIMLFSLPQTPDRTAYLRGESAASPVPTITNAARTLADLGADYIAVPCITLHGLFECIPFTVPVINMIDETLKDIALRGLTSFGLLATDGTIKANIFEKSAEQYGIDVVLPPAAHQQLIMSIIYDNIKKGRPVDLHIVQEVVDGLLGLGTQAIVLGCTELSLLGLNDAVFVDPLVILAKKCVSLCMVQPA